MTPEVVLDLFRQGMYLIVIMISVIIGPGLLVGLFVAMFQAATQINEMSLSFIPKLFATLFALVIAAPWLLNLLTSFSRNLIERIPSLIG